MYGTKENYAKQQAEFSTYAFLTENGQWFQPGKMGWFGFSTQTADSRQEYRDRFQKYLQEAIAKDLYITIVNCHI